ncbi:hypothetical protein JXI42_01635 [bacterium]|nr:hypothetical protein [bacterium]
MAKKILFIICLIALIYHLESMGIEIGADPSIIDIYDVPIGTEYEIDQKIKIRNTNPDDYTFKIEVLSLKQTAFYSPLPNTSWVNLENTLVDVDAKSNSEPIGISIKIPNDEKYYNQHWEAQIQVTIASSGNISAGIIIKFLIETSPNGQFVPEGDFVAYPSVINLNNVLDSIIIFNNFYHDYDSVTIGWTSTWYSFSKGNGELPEGLWISEKKFLWRTPVNSITVDGFERKVLYISCDESKFTGSSKGILYFKTTDNKTSFVRIERISEQIDR